jgi:hypothetical protein
MLRRNRDAIFWEIRLSDISQARFLRARSCNSASGASRADLMCWTHFCSSHTSTAPAKLRCACLTFFPPHKVFQWTHFYSFLLLAVNGTGEACTSSRCGPSFPRSLRFATPTGADSSRWVRRPRGLHSFLRWTHFYSFRLIDEEPSLHAFDFTDMFAGLRDIGIQEALQRG